jgi:SAM-dependent methyltransferase
VAFKTTTRQGWDAVAQAWVRWNPVLAAWLGPVTEAMLDMAHLRQGDKIVDVAAGAGEPGLTAAERVGPTGSVLATDLSAKILTFADGAARERGVRNFATRVMDAEQLELADGAFNGAFSSQAAEQWSLASPRRISTASSRSPSASSGVVSSFHHRGPTSPAHSAWADRV